ncbi:hypothetical protein T459_18885 [Capsicum annuum]|uniref:Mediator of RNA polymerase II transcription subunit 14 n=1 Tax=Capsicum annuum TaxID=4072 RepID=A0A2G2Z057_CAPAN|nr:hypothetical protein T459_18885 [Capsicum annuum]
MTIHNQISINGIPKVRILGSRDHQNFIVEVLFLFVEIAKLGQQTVDFSALVSRAAEESYVTLKELVEKCKSSDLSDSEKKIGILKYVVKTQQRILHLNVLSKWCQQSCNNYRGIKLLSHTMKVWEKGGRVEDEDDCDDL